MTHSPAPWRVSHDEKDAMTFNGQQPTAVLDANGWPVACNTTYYPTTLDPDNAHLIAAAPDLLAALEELVRCAENVQEISGGTVQHSFMYNAQVVAVAAIAKARGETR